jgi:hypothetical protein
MLLYSELAAERAGVLREEARRATREPGRRGLADRLRSRLLRRSR